MRRLLLVALLVACSQPARAPERVPPPGLQVETPPPRPVDAAVAVEPAPAEVKPAEPPRPYRTDRSDYDVDPKVAGTGKTFMVASEHELATNVGRDVLASGGNAVDAAVATAFALAVTLPRAGNIGGGGFAVVRTGKSKISALDFRETAPAAATADMFKAPQESLVGPKASGVPGSVAGLWALHKKWGKKTWKDLVAPAIALARDGYPVDSYLHEWIDIRLKGGFGVAAERSKAFEAMFSADGKALPVGTIIKNPELGIVLERIAAKGPDGFYKGQTAKAIAAYMKAEGGIITEKDLAGYKVVWREPIAFTYRGKKIATMPPPSSGGIVLAMTANMLRGHDLAKLGWHSVDHVRWLVEVWRRAYAARNEVLGDPAYVKNMPVKKLLSQAEADRLVKTIGERATPSRDVPALLEGTQTTHLSVVDPKGMAVAMTTTLNTSFGSGVIISGILMNNEMDDFATRPGQPNVYGLVQGTANKIEPGKRMLSSMSPTIIEDENGELFMVAGAQGGPRIISSVWQALSNVIDFGLPADAAVAAPRIHHQHLPDDIVVEDEAISREVEEQLRARGYEIVWGKRDRIFAGANAIVRTPSGWAGTADRRAGGAALGD